MLNHMSSGTDDYHRHLATTDTTVTTAVAVAVAAGLGHGRVGATEAGPGPETGTINQGQDLGTGRAPGTAGAQSQGHTQKIVTDLDPVITGQGRWIEEGQGHGQATDAVQIKKTNLGAVQELLQLKKTKWTQLKEEAPQPSHLRRTEMNHHNPRQSKSNPSGHGGTNDFTVTSPHNTSGAHSCTQRSHYRDIFCMTS